MAILPWQKEMLNKIMNASGGFKAGEMSIIMAGRQTGKSYLNQWYDALYRNRRNSVNYTIEAQAIVDGEQWYTVRIYKTDMLAWLQNQTSEHFDILQAEHPYVTLVDMHEQLYMMMVLRWGNA